MKFNTPVSIHVFAYRAGSKRISWEFRPFQFEKDIDNNIIFCTLFFSINANELGNVKPGEKLTLTHKTDNDYFIEIEYKSLKKALEKLDATFFLNSETNTANEENTHEDKNAQPVNKKELTQKRNQLNIKLHLNNSQDITLQGNHISENSKEFTVYNDDVKIASFSKTIINYIEVN